MKTKNNKSVKPGSQTGLWWLIIYVLTGGHPERANNKIGSRKIDIILYGAIVVIAIIVVIFVVLKNQ